MAGTGRAERVAWRGGGRASALVAVVACLASLITWSAGPRPAGAIEARDLVVPEEARILDGLRSLHPRVILTPESVEAATAKISSDATTATMYAAVRARAYGLLTMPPVVVTTNGQEGMLQVSQEALRRMQDLGLVWLVERDPVVAARAWVELEAVTGFADWNPLHFLDTAEMTHAVAIGYDWLYDAFTDAQRAVLVTAIVDKGLTPASDAYAGRIPLLLASWLIADHNWNNVVNGGMILAALAVGDVEPDVARYVAHEALLRLPAALAQYAPDGGWPEGVSYWDYATTYTVYTITALESALGTDFDLSRVSGLDRTGEVPIFMTGPSGQRWNWADDGEPRFAPAAPFEFWLAQRYGRAAFRDYGLEHLQSAALDVIWYVPDGVPPEVLRPDHAFTGVDVATMRTAWDDPAAMWVGVKGGQGGFNHDQLDAGSFVVESQGERFALDLGREDYDVPGYFEPWVTGRRWTYYRSRAEGHNTLVVDPDACADQDPSARSVITRYRSASDGAFALVDLTSVYRGVPARRGVGLFGRSHAVVQDELAPVGVAEVWWGMHTRADIVLTDGGRTAVLTQNGVSLVAGLQAPSSATFSVETAAPLPTSPQQAANSANTGVRKLAVHLLASGPTTIAVDFRPSGSPPATDAVTPLSVWQLQGAPVESVDQVPVATVPSVDSCHPEPTGPIPTEPALDGPEAIVAEPVLTG